MRMFDKVAIPGDRVGTILEVFNDGEAYLVEFETPNGPHRYDDDVFEAGEVEPLGGATDARG